jgi:acetylornithine aminotransferase/acetylornithine/N-succinyldiaminopimelate aminotransferase
MKEIVPSPPAIVRNEQAAIQAAFDKHVLPTYARFNVAFSHGAGSELFDVNGKRYLDLGGGIAVCCLGHAHPEIADALAKQSQKLIHVSNLYYHEMQGRLAAALAAHIAPGKVFFCNSGAEANEGLFKLARKFGYDEGRFEILTTSNSFHGRTLAGIAATGQEKVKAGFAPMMPGFRQVPYNDLAAMRQALSPATAAILIEGIQGEGGITPALPEYLLGLRQLCDEKNLLLLMDGVQCGHFRTGRFQSFQRILEDVPGHESFLPDAIAMAKSLGGGFPIGAIWVREKHAGLLGPGTHGTTFGGTPLGCAVALRILEVIQRERLPENARELGAWLKSQLQRLAAAYPQIICGVRGLGLILGFELVAKEAIPALAANDKSASIQFVDRMHEAGALVVPSGAQVIRLLPPLNLTRAQASEGIAILERVLKSLT